MTLRGKRILIFAGPDFEDLELWYPKLRLVEEGATVTVAGLGNQEYRGKRGYPVVVDCQVETCHARDFDAVVIPGGYAPDHFRRSQKLLDLVREMDAAGKPVAAICHGGWVPVSARIVRGRKMTGFFAIRDDIINAGAQYLDEPVVVDGNLITSRVPTDLPHFCRALIGALTEQREVRCQAG